MISFIYERSCAAEHKTLFAFTHVPRTGNHADGWTVERQQRFVTALADIGSVCAAAKAVNMASEGTYQLRRKPDASAFRAA